MSLVPILQLEMFKVEHIWLYSLLVDLIVTFLINWLTVDGEKSQFKVIRGQSFKTLVQNHNEI